MYNLNECNECGTGVWYSDEQRKLCSDESMTSGAEVGDKTRMLSLLRLSCLDLLVFPESQETKQKTITASAP